MVKPLCSLTVCQVVTLRDCGLKFKSNSTWSRDPVHSMHTNITWNQIISRPKNRAEDPQNSQKIRKKLVTDLLKDPKTSLERIRVVHNAFFCYDTISRGTVRRILKKYGVFPKNAAKMSVWRRKASVFVKNGESTCKRSRSFSGRILFLLVKQGCASPATELSYFLTKWNEISWKKRKKIEFGRTIFYVLGCNTIKWPEIAC